MNLFLTINRFHRQYMTKMSAILTPYGMTPANWSLLQFLHINEMVTSRQIADYWEVEKPTVSANVKALLQKNLITAVTGEDKREKKLVLTTAGEDLYEQLHSEIYIMQQTLLQTMTPETQKLFKDSLLAMEAILKGDAE